MVAQSEVGLAVTVALAVSVTVALAVTLSVAVALLVAVAMTVAVAVKWQCHQEKIAGAPTRQAQQVQKKQEPSLTNQVNKVLSNYCNEFM